MDQLTLPRTGAMTRLYFVFVDAAKHPAPVRDVIAAAIDACRVRNPDATPDVLMLHPCHEAVLGPVVSAHGQIWQTSYNGLLDPREVRVGPVD